MCWDCGDAWSAMPALGDKGWGAVRRSPGSPLWTGMPPQHEVGPSGIKKIAKAPQRSAGSTPADTRSAGLLLSGGAGGRFCEELVAAL